MRTALLAIACLAMCAPAAFAGDDDARWGVTIWGLSYHLDKTIDYDEQNWGAGLRRYLSRRVFLEGDVLRNSNRGVVIPASVGVELGMGTLFHACRVSAVGTLTLAYYQNLRTDTSDLKVGPVPGVAVRCGRIQPTVVAVFSRSKGLLAVAGALTIHF